MVKRAAIAVKKELAENEKQLVNLEERKKHESNKLKKLNKSLQEVKYTHAQTDPTLFLVYMLRSLELLTDSSPHNRIGSRETKQSERSRKVRKR